MVNETVSNYHEEEYRIAMDPTHPNHLMPTVTKKHSHILGVGCGAGQTLAAIQQRCDWVHSCVGIDIDQAAIEYGRQRWPTLALFGFSADEGLFGQADKIDLVISRVALPYMNIPVVLRDMARMLTPDGDLWIVVHTWAFVRQHWWAAVTSGEWKHAILMTYAAANGLWFHLTGRVFRLFGRSESWQSESAMRRALEGSGFWSVTWEPRGTCAVMTARKGTK